MSTTLQEIHFNKNNLQYTLKYDITLNNLTIDVIDRIHYRHWSRVIFDNQIDDSHTNSHMKVTLTPETLFKLFSTNYGKTYYNPETPKNGINISFPISNNTNIDKFLKIKINLGWKGIVSNETIITINQIPLTEEERLKMMTDKKNEEIVELAIYNKKLMSKNERLEGIMAALFLLIVCWCIYGIF